MAFNTCSLPSSLFSPSLHTSRWGAGQFSQEVLAGLDWLLVEAGRRGLRLLLTLTNYWKEFGGMQQYLR